ncbi:MAG: T9SS type A sorting domain-containing protein [Bacteroidetes bacterium]|nr:MAG: T9SS type A sorting domain-containing protein [Bacteroidota bacterium]
MIRKSIVLGLALAIAPWAKGQTEGVLPLKKNTQLQGYGGFQQRYWQSLQVGTASHGLTDTLSLPFFDDFSADRVYPSASKWTDHAVFVNPDFPINPPSLNVATFDGLNSQGRAYDNLSGGFGSADTLTSQAINLSALLPSDSVMLSFFYQAQGRSFEVLTVDDSLVVQFKNKIGAWVNVWQSPGITRQDFKAAVVALGDSGYFHEGFQFRFLNYQTYIGNLKQWHVDYVYLNQGRNSADTVFEDQAMVYLPETPFNTYTSLPWAHLQSNFNKYLKTNYTIPVNNLSNSGETFSIGIRGEDENGQVGGVNLQGQSLAASGQSSFNLTPVFTLQPNSQDSSYLILTSKLGDILGGNDIKENDSAIRYVELANYYAYDDGTAESGYGIRNGAGSVSCGFELEQGDTLRAISIHYTQAETPVSSGVTLNIWRSLAPVGQPNIGVDVLAHSFNAGLPTYTDTINGFHVYKLDTALYFDSKVYVGWTQNGAFMLNVGLDRNYRYQGQDTANPNVLYNVSGRWEQSSVSGTPMIRVHFGKAIPNPLSAGPQAKVNKAIIFPNPSSTRIHIEGLDIIKHYQIFSIDGRMVMSGKDTESIAIGELQTGIYFLRCQDVNGNQYQGKLNKH